MTADAGPSGLSTTLEQLVAAGTVHGGLLGVATPAATQVLPFGHVTVAGERRPAQRDDRFLLTSVTKPFTAMLVLRAIEQGRFHLHTPVAELVPEFGVAGKHEVTIAHLLTHTSGLDDTAANTAEGPARGMQPHEHLAAACAAPLRAVPGSRVAYCSPPFWVLAEVARRCFGTPFSELLVTTVLRPLGMRDTAFHPAASPPPRYVDAEMDHQEHAHLPEQVRRLAYPAGGLVGTVDDLLTAGRSLLATREEATAPYPLAPATLRAMWTPRTKELPGWRTYEPCPWPTERGLGWALGGPGDLTGDDALWHSGGSGTAVWIDPAAATVIVLLTATWFLSAGVQARIANAALASVAREHGGRAP